MRNDEAVVYIVDDESIVRRSFERLFKLAGFSVTAFASAEDFLSGCPADACGCLLLDVQMPGLTGLDLQQELSAHNIFLPIVFITGKGDIPMTVKAMKAGAADFLSKPCDETELLEAARAAMREEENLEARRLAEQAKLDALLAEATAQTALRREAAEAIRTDIEALRAEAERAANRIPGETE